MPKGIGNRKSNFEKKYGLPKSALRIKKGVRRITTIEDLLTRDDINGILVALDKVKPHISDMIVIYFDKERNILDYIVTDETLVSKSVWMLEATKLDILNGDKE